MDEDAEMADADDDEKIEDEDEDDEYQPARSSQPPGLYITLKGPRQRWAPKPQQGSGSKLQEENTLYYDSERAFLEDVFLMNWEQRLQIESLWNDNFTQALGKSFKSWDH